MMTVTLVCAITFAFVAPADWKVTEVVPGGTYSNLAGSGYNPTRVTLTKQIKPGDSVEPPKGCVSLADAGQRSDGYSSGWIQVR